MLVDCCLGRYGLRAVVQPASFDDRSTFNCGRGRAVLVRRRDGHAAYCANKSNWRRSQSMQIPTTIQPRRERTGRRITQRLATPALSDYVPGCRNTTTEPEMIF
jgi:hypothetical protein